MGLLADFCFFFEQGGLAHSLQASNKGVTDTAVGLAAVVRTRHLLGVACVLVIAVGKFWMLKK